MVIIFELHLKILQWTTYLQKMRIKINSYEKTMIVRKKKLKQVLLKRISKYMKQYFNWNKFY